MIDKKKDVICSAHTNFTKWRGEIKREASFHLDIQETRLACAGASGTFFRNIFTALLVKENTFHSLHVFFPYRQKI